MARTRDKDKPRQIIDAAFKVFGDVGYEATVMKDIADKAGIAPGTIYTYFNDKKDLFRATAREGWNRFLAQMQTLVRSGAPIESRLSQFIEIGFSSLKHYLPLLRGMLFESSQMNILQESTDAFCALVEELLSGHRAPPERLVVGPGRRSELVRITVLGVLFSAAMAPPSRVDAEIDELKATVTAMLGGG
jgi:AcrR family transcriptional regulator